MSYQAERDQFIATAAALGLPLHVARALLRAATTINRYAELACSSEAADRDRVKCPMSTRRSRPGTIGARRDETAKPCLCDGDHDAGPNAVTRITVLEAALVRRLEKLLDEVNADLNADAIDPGAAPKWRIITAGDPRGYVLRVVPPAYAVENRSRPEHDPRSIGVPSGPSGLKW